MDNTPSKSELLVNKMLEDRKRLMLSRDYENWPLRRLPFSVIWNEFSRSGIYLREGQYD